MLQPRTSSILKDVKMTYYLCASNAKFMEPNNNFITKSMTLNITWQHHTSSCIRENKLFNLDPLIIC
jgi:hypothetical protein